MGHAPANRGEDFEHYNCATRRARVAMSVARIAVAGSVLPALDYWVPSNLDVRAGHVVRLPLGTRRAVGVVVECDVPPTLSRDKLRTIDAVADDLVVPGELLDVVRFVADYYQEPLGAVIGHALPPSAAGPSRAGTRAPLRHALRLNAAGVASLAPLVARAPARRALFDALQRDGGMPPAEAAALRGVARRALAEWRERGWVDALPMPATDPALTAVLPTLNAEQAAALAAISGTAGRYAPWLLQGITGSGKTAVYLAAAAARMAAGGQVLMLVPEINLTPQLEDDVRAALPDVPLVTLHSGLAAGERRARWQAAASGEARLVLGTRLAVFAPLPRLALVVVDEEHDPSYKQQDGVRYHARDVAVWRARARGVPVVLGSATPSLETFHHAEAGRYGWLRLTARARPGAQPPRISLVPARVPDAHEGLVPALWHALRTTVAAGGQALVFVNRRGFAPALKCGACQWEAHCTRCTARLTLHRAPRMLCCHHCGATVPVPAQCPECGNVDLIPRGHGTQRLEAALEGAFGAGRVVRVDRDSMRARRAFADLRARVAARDVDVLVGTQMLAKGHDFPRLTLVGVLGADNALYSADFRATERLGALLAQVAGRAGRAAERGDVVVQTDFPEHPVYRSLASGDYDAFARGLLAERAAAALPPYAHLALLSAEAHARADVEAFLDEAHRAACATREALGPGGDTVDIGLPVSALMARRAGFERGQIVISARDRAPLQRLLRAWRATLDTAAARRVRWALDVDPAAF
ncbi:MAG: primosomal protein N' [Proteobacteria bacterium]|nr:primosomal protein N' [Pseudomonadota bacterium]